MGGCPGGTDSIVIGRIGEDQTCTILKTSYAGFDRNGNREFIAESPEGLSEFGLIATTAPHSKPGIIQNVFDINGWFGPVILVIFVIGLILGYGTWRARRKNKN
jgi:hypothetical protein